MKRITIEFGGSGMPDPSWIEANGMFAGTLPDGEQGIQLLAGYPYDGVSSSITYTIGDEKLTIEISRSPA